MRSPVATALFVSLLVLGCHNLPNKVGPAYLKPESIASSTLGVVVFSTGANHACTQAATFLNAVRNDGGPPFRSPNFDVDSRFGKSEFADHTGYVNAWSMPPGKYYLVPYKPNTYSYSPKELPTFDFEVLAGETVYLGEIFMPVSCTYHEAFVLNDRFERDRALAEVQNPALKDRAMVKRLAVPGEIKKFEK